MSSVSDRLKMLAQKRGDIARIAQISGIAKQTVSHWINGRGEPQISNAAKLAAAAGVRLEWLATGVGPMRAGEGGEGADAGDAESVPAAVAPAPATDHRLMGRLIDGLMALYKEIGQRLPPCALGELAGQMHDDIVSATADPEERLSMVKLVVAQHRRQALQATVDTTAKRRA